MLCRQRQAPLCFSQDGPRAPPTSHRQPAGRKRLFTLFTFPPLLTSSWSLIKGTSQRAGSLGPLFLFHCIRCHIWPWPHLDRLFLHLIAQLFPGGDGTRSANPHGQALQPCHQPCQHRLGWLRAARSPPLPLPMDMVQSGQPHVAMPTLSQQEERGTAARM